MAPRTLNGGDAKKVVGGASGCGCMAPGAGHWASALELLNRFRMLTEAATDMTKRQWTGSVRRRAAKEQAKSVPTGVEEVYRKVLRYSGMEQHDLKENL